MPNVSFCNDDRNLHYNPYEEPPILCKVSYLSARSEEIEFFEMKGSGELTKAMLKNAELEPLNDDYEYIESPDGSKELFNGYSYDNIRYIELGNSCTSIGDETLKSTSLRGDLIIPNSVSTIGYNAFNGCRSLRSVTLGSGITSMASSVFSGCSSLESLTIIDGASYIGTSAFAGCSGLTGDINIPSSISYIGSQSFASCKSLNSITINAIEPPTTSGIYGDSGMFYNTNNCPIYVPSGSVEAYKTATFWSKYADRIQAIQ